MLNLGVHFSKRRIGKSVFVLLGVFFVLLPVCCANLAWAKEKVEYKDIYLNENRVCKACRVERVDQRRVRLVNRAGQAAIVPVKEVMGANRHPLLRRAIMHGLYGIGLAGPVIVPAAFDDGNDYVCKYCSTFGR